MPLRYAHEISSAILLALDFAHFCCGQTINRDLRNAFLATICQRNFVACRVPWLFLYALTKELSFLKFAIGCDSLLRAMMVMKRRKKNHHSLPLR